jgi:WD40 repeat protein/tRNA A-37 threonylcarbamoyl transferase component Bud32
LSIDPTPPPLPQRVELNPDFPRVRGYEIIAVVGIGGMGIVYEAQHKELNRRVAIKTLRGEALADREYRERFRAEAEAIARLQHANIIQVFEIGSVEALPFEPNPSPFIALEFVDGGSLANHARAPQPPRSAAKMIETLARAAHAVHLLGVIHRDLKPANVLLTREGEPKIADFGIAKQLDTGKPNTGRSLTRAGTVMGTPEYMAPEQLDGGEATAAIDIYALGVILYELLTARVPFQGATFADTMMLALRQEPVPPRRLQPTVPRDLETICLKCLEKDPSMRYATAEALADDLAAWAEGRTIKARAAGPAERTLRWAKRNPAVAVLSVLVCLVALTGLTGIVWGWDEARRNAAKAEANAREAEANAEAARLAASDAREAMTKERWEHYRASVFAASSALRLYDTNAARRALDEAPAEFRDWVWRQLYAHLDRSQVALKVCPQGMRGAVFAANGQCVITYGEDKKVRVWNLRDRTEVWGTAEEDVRAPTLSDDGLTLAYGDKERVVHLYNLATGRDRIVLRGNTRHVYAIKFAPGDRVVTLAEDRSVRVWDTRDGRELHQFTIPLKATGPQIISPNGCLLAVRGTPEYATRVWNLETKHEVVFGVTSEAALLSGFSPDSERFVTVGAFPDTTTRLWEVKTGKLLATMHGHTNQVTRLVFSPDGKRMLTASMDRSVRVWDASPEQAGRDSEALLVLRGHTGWVEHAAFSPDGRRIVSSSHDRTMRYWDAKTGELLAVLCGHTAEVHAAAFLEGAPVLVSASADGTLRFWDVAEELDSGYAMRGHKLFAYSAAFFPDSNRVVSTAWDGTARIWDATTSHQLKVFDHGDDWFVASVAVHPEGRLLATLARSKEQNSASLRLWNVETGAMLRHWPIPAGWQDGRLAFAPQGNLLAAGCADFRIRLFDVKTMEALPALEGHTAPVRDVAFSPDGRWLASAGDDGDRTVRIWDVKTKTQVKVLTGARRCVYTVAWNREGTMLASGSIDGNVRLWDTKTWETVGQLKNGAWVYGVAFTKDGKLLTAACRDNLIRVWDIRMQRELAELSGHHDYVHHLAFSPDGTRLISASGDCTLRVWDTLSKADRAKK